MSKIDRSWTTEQNEALMKVIATNPDTAEAFFAAYYAASGDKVHGIGGIVFHAMQMESVLRVGLTRDLRKKLEAAMEAHKVAKRVASTPPPVDGTVWITPAETATPATSTPAPSST